MRMANATPFVAAVLFASTTAFAQTTTAPKTTTSAKATSESPATPVTLVGCIQKEADYRKEHNIRRGGGLNMGIGEADEFVLINASRVSPGSAPAMSGDCSSPGSGEAFELTGKEEDHLKGLVGKRVEITGTQKRAKIGANGQPTGGTDPMHGDLKLFEIEVSSAKEVSAVTAQASSTEARTETAPAPAPAPEPAPTTTAPAPAPAPAATTAPAPTGTSGQAEQPRASNLPHTASPLPLYELTSLLFFGGAYGVRRLRRRL